MKRVDVVVKIHAYEGFCEDLARQNTVAHLSQLQLGSSSWCPKDHYLGHHTLLGYQRSSALFRPVCLSSTCLSVFNLSVYHLIANPIACASFPRLAHLLCR